MNRSLGFGIFILSLLTLVACQSAEPEARARRVVTRADLIGGPSALGEVGDYLLENDKIRIIVQDKGFSRGFGVYGGGLIDADLVRPIPPGGAAGGNGRDQFGELFPIALLQALEPNKVEVVRDGQDGGAAVVRVSGAGGDFFSLTKTLNQLVLSSHLIPSGLLPVLDVTNMTGTPRLAYEVMYRLEPGAKHVQITYRMSNISEDRVPVPAPDAITLLGLLDFELDLDTFNAPLGMVMLFGAGNKVFNPGSGYNLRFGIEKAYAAGGEAGLQFPVLPGLLTPGLISTSKNGVSYGLFAEPAPRSETFVNGREATFGIPCPSASAATCAEMMDEKCDADLTVCEEKVASMMAEDDECSDQACCDAALVQCKSRAATGECFADGQCGYQMYEHAYGQPVTRDTMLVPFVASAFTGVFHGQTPSFFEPIPPEHRCSSDVSCDSAEHSGVCCLPSITDPEAERASCSSDDDCSGGRECQEGECIEPVLGWCAPVDKPDCLDLPDWTGESIVEFSTYFVVGDGDAGSVMDSVHKLKGDATQLLAGQVIDAMSTEPLDQLSVLIYQQSSGDGEFVPVNQFYTDQTGRFKGSLAPGNYVARVHRPPLLSEPAAFTIEAERGEFLTLSAPSTGTVSVQVLDPSGRRLPAKVTVVGRTEQTVFDRYRYLHESGLFEPSAGQEWRVHDLVPDDPNEPSTREYIESAHYTENGSVVFDVPPGRSYDLYVSRGTEYSLDVHRNIRVAAGQTQHVAATIRRVVPTPGYVSADFHLHAQPSLDSALPLEERVRSILGEGVEVLVATDHNFVTDYAPTIAELGLQSWASSIVGIEMTTLESGHFNGFPLEREVGAITKGAFEWSQRPPGDIFDELREMSSLSRDETIIQVNHPRDSILGYFAQYDLDALSGVALPPASCVDLDFMQLEAMLEDCLLSPNGPAFRGPDDQTAFSFDFDAIEVINGSVVGQLHHQRIPQDGLASLDRLPQFLEDAAPPAGSILCDEDGQVAFPGAADDWFNLLNRGLRIAGTGTSDSHDAHDHPGAGRTYVYVGHDDPAAVTPADIVAGVKSGRIVATSGPFVELFVNEQPMGSEVVVGQEQTLNLRFEITTPEWMTVDHATLWGNGAALMNFDAPADQSCEDNQGARCWRWSGNYTVTEDTWFVLEVSGQKSMFPVQRPIDLPPILIQDAISTFAEPLGLVSADYGDMNVERFGSVTPVAMTNPIWVDMGEPGFEPPWVFDANGVEQSGRVARCAFDADGNSLYHALPAGPDADVGAAQQALKKRPKYKPSYGHPRLKNNIFDVRVLFEQFGAHGH